jgi:hypothetical protein
MEDCSRSIPTLIPFFAIGALLASPVALYGVFGRSKGLL